MLKLNRSQRAAFSASLYTGKEGKPLHIPEAKHIAYDPHLDATIKRLALSALFLVGVICLLIAVQLCSVVLGLV